MMNQLERRQQELTFLAEVAHALATTDALDIILPLILDRITMLVDGQAAAVVGLPPEREELVVLASQRAGPEAEPLRGRVFPRAGTIVDSALVERAVQRIDPGSPAAFDPVVQALLGGRRPANGVVVPLRVTGAERGGLIVLDQSEPASAEDLRILIAFADQAAVAIDRAQLRRTRSDDAARLKVLNAVLQVTTSGFEEETLIRRAMEALLGAAPADRAELVTLDGGEPRVRFTHEPEVHAERSGADHRRRAIQDRVVETGEPLVRKGPWTLRSGEEPYVICVPLAARDRVLGALLLARCSVPYDDAELEMLVAVGRHLGTAIEFARIFRRVATEAEELERVAAERSAALQDAQEQLSRSQWLASLGELAAGVAHDLNNALNPVVAFAELIKEHSDQPERIRKYAERILMAAQGGAETVRRIQRFTRRRLGSLPFEPIPVAEMVREAIELTRPNWSQRMTGGPVTVEESVDPDLHVQGNAAELRQALLNLIGNALDAMPSGGTIRFVSRADGDQVVLAVQDTGVGMPKNVLDRALEPFFTTKGTHGTGLGLAEVFGIARRHGGDLDLESREWVGTTVILRLPRAQAPAAPAEVRRRLAGSSRNLHHILLIDDNLLSLEATAASLRAAGHTVATAANAQTALRIFSAGRFDLVLSDLGLPDMNGWELVDRLRLRSPEIRIGMITGWSIPEGDEELRQRGIDLVFVKPIDPDQLLDAL